MRNATQHLITLTDAHVDYGWCVRARLIDPSDHGWQEFLAGYLSMEEFFEHSSSPANGRAVVHVSAVLTGPSC